MPKTMVPGVLLATVLALATAGQAAGHEVDVPTHGTSHLLRADVHPRSDAWENRVLVLTNKRRLAHGLDPLAASTCADGFAEPWTRHLARKRVLKHQQLGPMLGCPHTSTAGENIAYGYETPRALVSAWMHSPGHRANILGSSYDRLGVAAWVSTDGVTYATQDFIG